MCEGRVVGVGMCEGALMLVCERVLVPVECECMLLCASLVPVECECMVLCVSAVLVRPQAAMAEAPMSSKSFWEMVVLRLYLVCVCVCVCGGMVCVCVCVGGESGGVCV